MLKSKITPVLAASALVIAVFGSTPLGHAAQNLVLAKNSVGAAQLKKGAVTSAKIRGNAVTSAAVKNGSLLAADFKAGQLPTGPQGPQGLKGDLGQQGPKGEQGTPGLAFLGASLTPPIALNAGGTAGPVTLATASRLLVHGVLASSSYTCAAASPTICKVQLVPIVDGKSQATSIPTLSIPQGQTKGFAQDAQILVVTDEVPAGEHNVGYGVVGTGQFNGQSASFGPRQVLAVG
jgi:hypothetical protein